MALQGIVPLCHFTHVKIKPGSTFSDQTHGTFRLFQIDFNRYFKGCGWQYTEQMQHNLSKFQVVVVKKCCSVWYSACVLLLFRQFFSTELNSMRLERGGISGRPPTQKMPLCACCLYYYVYRYYSTL